MAMYVHKCAYPPGTCTGMREGLKLSAAGQVIRADITLIYSQIVVISDGRGGRILDHKDPQQHCGELGEEWRECFALCTCLVF